MSQQDVSPFVKSSFGGYVWVRAQAPVLLSRAVQNVVPKLSK